MLTMSLTVVKKETFRPRREPEFPPYDKKSNLSEIKFAPYTLEKRLRPVSGLKVSFFDHCILQCSREVARHGRMLCWLIILTILSVISLYLNRPNNNHLHV